MERRFRDLDENELVKLYNYNWQPGKIAYFLKLDDNHKPVCIVKDVIYGVDRLYWKDKGTYSLSVRPSTHGLSSLEINISAEHNSRGHKYWTCNEYIGCYTSEAKAKKDLKEYCEFYSIPVPRAPRQVKQKISKTDNKKEDNPIKRKEILGNVYNKVLRRAGRPFGCSVMTNYYSIKPTDISLDTGKQLKVEWLQPSSFNTDVLINWKTDRVKASDLSVNELEQLIKIV